MKYSISSAATSTVTASSTKLADVSANVQAAMPLTQGLSAPWLLTETIT